MNTPQIIYLALVFVCLVDEIAKHGKPKTGEHNATTYAIATVLGILLLWWGGFFSQT